MVGRDEVLHTIAAHPPGSVTSITGLAGIGKTEVALHVVRMWQERLGPGCRVVGIDARGFDPDRPQLDASASLAGLLDGLGVPSQRYDRLDPAGRRALLWRELSSTPSVVLLDNVRDATLIMSLLPLPPRTRLLVTSRRALTGLPDGTVHRAVVLTELTEAAAMDLLAQTGGRDVRAEDPESAVRIVRAAGRIALDLTVAGALVAAQPEWTLADHAARLEALPRDVRLRPALQVGHDLLPAEVAATLRALALHPGPDLTEWVVAALAGVPDDVAADHLDRLVSEHLVLVDGRGRYLLHDVVRDFVCRLGLVTDPRSGQQAARDRLADAVLAQLGEHTRPGEPDVAWLSEGQASLLAVAQALPDWGRGSTVVEMALLLADYLEVTGQWSTCDALCSQALSAAPGERGVRRLRARSLEMRGRLDEAMAELERARDTADVTDAEATRVVNGIGNIHKQRGQYRLAARAYARAVRLAASQGQDMACGRALGNLAETLRLIGHPQLSAQLYDACEQHAARAGDDVALAIAVSNRPLLAEALGDHLGAVRLGHEAVRKLDAMGFAPLAAISRGWLARHCELTGNVEVCARELERAEAELTRHELGEALALLHVTRGRLLRRRGQTSQAEEVLLTTLERARANDWGSPQVEAMVALGDLACDADQEPKAAEWFHRAVALAERHGRQPELQAARASLARVQPPTASPLAV